MVRAGLVRAPPAPRSAWAATEGGVQPPPSVGRTTRWGLADAALLAAACGNLTHGQWCQRSLAQFAPDEAGLVRGLCFRVSRMRELRERPLRTTAHCRKVRRVVRG